MPTKSDRAAAADALHQAFLVNLIAEAESQLYKEGLDSDYSSSASSRSSGDLSTSSSSDDEPLPETSDAVLETLGQLYSVRYLNSREEINKDGTQLHLLLHDYKFNRPEIFRSYLRIDPGCFDDLVHVLKDDPVFHNNSHNPQMPVDEQFAIALFRFGHYGNAASMLKVALWAGIGFGTVPLVTNRVLKATCSERFRKSALHWSSPEAKEAAKAWVQDASCPAWRDGWLMVDGTLVPLFMRPGFFGNTFFDRKSNYSLNVQVSPCFYVKQLKCLYSHEDYTVPQIISTPNLQIIDYGVGLPGSQHDSTAWLATRIPHEHNRLMQDGEWVWGDSAYPLKDWCQAPYKK